MCGICGYISKKAITIEQLKKMNDTMYHRGPNDSGEEIFDITNGYQLGMAQRRLSIQDLSMLGHQPMHSCNERVIITYNGEIYNFLELRQQLKDYPFKSHCDTEVILAAYLKWGLSCIDKFQGMFAIALYDRELNTLYLVRDRIGKKPLYYWLDGENIVFASELKPIMEYPDFPRQIRTDVINRYLFQQYICEPDSIFQNVYKVEPGQIVSFDMGQVKKWKYWDVAKVYQQKKTEKVGTYEEAKEELKGILKDAVQKRMIADVPLGTFLSGGYDSSLVTAIAQSISNVPIKTFSVGFEDERYNEAKYAKEVAQYLGTDHTECYISEKDMLGLVESIPKYYDEPFADSSQIATMLVSRLARDYVTVALSGDGGDEFFCGYNIYKKVEQAQKLDALGMIAHQIGKIGNLEEKYPFKVRVISQNREKNAKTQFIAGNYLDVSMKMVKSEENKNILLPYYDFEDKYQEKNWQERRMLLDMDTYLPGDILCKVDRASMKYSLETRCPILDTYVMEYAFSIPHEYKYNKGNKKRILKDIAYDYIPGKLLDRPKVGFAVPVDQWLRGTLKEQLLDYCAEDYLKRQGLFNENYVRSFINKYLEAGDAGKGTGANYSRLIWGFFVFQQWYEYNM